MPSAENADIPALTTPNISLPPHCTFRLLQLLRQSQVRLQSIELPTTIGYIFLINCVTDISSTTILYQVQPPTHNFQLDFDTLSQEKPARPQHNGSPLAAVYLLLTFLVIHHQGIPTESLVIGKRLEGHPQNYPTAWVHTKDTPGSTRGINILQVTSGHIRTIQLRNTHHQFSHKHTISLLQCRPLLLDTNSISCPLCNPTLGASMVLMHSRLLTHIHPPHRSPLSRPDIFLEIPVELSSLIRCR